MRRVFLAVGLISAAGCAEIRDVFTAHSDMAAEAGNQQLPAERVAELLVRTKGVQVSPEAAEFISNVWVDYTLFAEAVASGTLPDDSASIAEVMWSNLAELKATHWYDTLLARRAPANPSLADSVYAADSVRVFQHILFRVSPDAPSEERGATRRKAEQTLSRVQRGADFGTLAGQLSDDPGSRRNAGFLPPTARGGFVTAFDSAGWTLTPGGLSGVVETPFGYHIIYRPDPGMVRERLQAWHTQQVGARLDSIYLDDLGKASNLEVKSSAPALMRAAVRDPRGKHDSQKKLSTFDGGGLTVEEFLRWVQTPELNAAAGQIGSLEDEQLTRFAEMLSTNVLLLRQADSAGITVDAVEWESIEAFYHAAVDTLRMALGLNSDVTDSTVALAERLDVAALKIDDFFSRLTQGRVRLRPLPSSLAAMLRARSAYRVHPTGLTRAVDLAQGMQAETPAGAETPPSPALKPAPGPPPIPGTQAGEE